MILHAQCALPRDHFASLFPLLHCVSVLCVAVELFSALLLFGAVMSIYSHNVLLCPPIPIIHDDSRFVELKRSVTYNQWTSPSPYSYYI